MKRVIALVLVLLLTVGLAACRTGGGERSFEAVIDRIEGDTAYATVTAEDAAFGTRVEGNRKLPAQIIFSTALLETELKPGNAIRGQYLKGTIDGQSVRVVTCHVIEVEP